MQNDLQSGTTLSSLAEQKGVSSSDLLASVEQDLQANAPQGAPGVSSTHAQQMATNLINGTPPQPPTGGAGAYGRDGQGGFRLQPPSFSDTAQLLGISSQQLQSDLQSGTTLSSLAQQKGVSSNDLLASVEQDLQANAPQGASSLSSSQLQQMASKLINASALSPAGSSGSAPQGGRERFDLYA
jgi:lambda repressor-like predicted transcriptional regulator